MYVPTRLGRWYFEESGKARDDGAAIVLFPSFLTDGGMWDGQMRPLGNVARTIAFDGPGHGKSETPPPFSLDDNARAVLDALDALGVKKFVMIGLSWGGMIGMRLATIAPDRVAALALLDTSAAPETMPNRVRYRAMLTTHRRVGLPAWVAERRVLPLYFSEETLSTHRELAENFWRDAVGFPREGVYKAGKAIFQRKDFRPELSRIRCDTLVMCGEGDRATPPERSREIASAIAGAELVFVEGAGHLSALEKPDRVNASLVPFAERHVSA
jgi:pimeloyl-ACP methyl ester carboxylesterase